MQQNKLQRDDYFESSVRHVVMTFLRIHFHECLLELHRELLKFASVAHNNQEQTHLFEVINLLDSKSHTLEKDFIAHISQQLFSVPSSAINTPNIAADETFYKLSIVDKDDFEGWLKVSTLIKRTLIHSGGQYELLKERYKHFVATPLEDDQIPFSPHYLSNSFVELMSQLELKINLACNILLVFEKTLLINLSSLYKKLNSTCKERGILPELEEMSKHRHKKPGPSALLTDAQAASTKTNENESPESTQSETIDNFPYQQFEGSDPNHAFYSSASSLLSLRRQVTDAISRQAPPSGDNYTDTDPSFEHSIDQVLSALQTIQRDAQVIPSLIEGKSLENTIKQELSKHLTPGQNKQLSSSVSDHIELIGNLLGVILNKADISTQDANFLRSLEFPLLRLAIQDKHFFQDDDYPARNALNLIAKLYELRGPKNNIVDREIKKAVTTINSEFDSNSAIFNQIVPALSQLLNRQQLAYERNAERVAKSYEGQEKLEDANRQVNNEINKRLGANKIPEVVLQLLDNGWRHLLVLTYLKQGTSSATWKECINIIDQLLNWLEPRFIDTPESSMERALQADSYIDLIDKQLNTAFPTQFKHVQTTQELRQLLEGEIKPVLVSCPRQEEVITGDKYESDDNIERWLERCEQLEVGMWLSNVQSSQQQEQLRIVWIANDLEKFVLVNKRGEKVLEHSKRELAEKMMLGLLPIFNEDEWPIMDQGLYQTVQNIYQQLAHNSCHDDLTGLINRREFERRLTIALADQQRHSEKYVLYSIDLDQFKLINDHCGNNAGDKLLREVTQILRNSLPPAAEIARMGSNEFAILLKNIDDTNGVRVAEIHRKAIENYRLHWSDNSYNLTASIGLLAIDSNYESATGAFQKVSSSISLAKKAGRNRVQIYTPDNEAQIEHDDVMNWLTKLESRLNQGTFRLRCHKIAPIGSSPDNGHYEILLACRDEQGNIVSPQPYIEAAERFQRMDIIDRWVVSHTFSELNEKPHLIERLNAVSINLSGSSMSNRKFIQFLLDEINRLNVVPEKICFEVTETATIANLADAADFMREIKKEGCKFSLDDFGTGLSSYEYLKVLPVDYVKIDGIFIKDIGRVFGDRAMVQSINEIGHMMGKKTIAEYVESQEIIDIISEMGIDYAQGYAIEMPLFMDEL